MILVELGRNGGSFPAPLNLPPFFHYSTRYTPISPPDAKGHFDLAIKVYKGERPGKVSSHFDSLKVGDSVDFKVSARGARERPRPARGRRRAVSF